MKIYASKKKFSLQLHIATLFALLIIISGLSLGWYSYLQLSQSMLNSGKTLFTTSSDKVTQKISRESDHIYTMLKILSASNLTKITTKEEKLTSLPVLSEMLKGTNSLSAFFVAYPNDDFFLFKKVTSKLILDKLNAPINSHFMMTLRESGSTIHHFYSIDGEHLKTVEDKTYNFQMKQRPWYQQAINSDSYITTDAYLFHASQEYGATLAVKDKASGAIIGADYTLSSLSRLLKQFQSYPSGKRVILDSKGNVIAFQDEAILLSKDGKFDKFKRVSEINQPVLTYAFEHYQNEKGSILFSYDGEDWLGRVSDLSSSNSLLLFQIVKTKELLSEAYKVRYKSVFITLFIILATLPIAWYFARLLTAPISGLTKDLEKIKNFDFTTQIINKSPIREISDLISVTNNMKETISHFQDLSASLVSKQSFSDLLKKVSKECNSIPNNLGTIIILAHKNVHEIKHCDLKGLDETRNKQLTLLLSGLSLLPDTLKYNSSHGIPEDVHQVIKTYLQYPHSLNWQLVPLKNRSGDDIGFIALLESPDAPLSRGKRQYAQAIASFSALSMQSLQLLADQKNLLESFILLIAGAIDSQSPYTGGHCARVPELTKMLSRAACDDNQGCYKHFDLSEDQWEELHIAAWLHDCGKIVTPEYIVDKATKLETIYDRLNEVRMRFELLKSEAEKCYWQGVATSGDKRQLAEQRDLLLKQLDEEFEFVAECNIGSEFMSDDKIERLQTIANRTWTRTLSNKSGIAPHQATKIADSQLPAQESLLADKAEHLIEREHAELTEPGNEWGFDMQTPVYRFNRGELYNLSIKRGTLTDEDRFIINGHIVHTIVMLSKLPFPDHLQQIPIIAGGHHEKMDGTGYPRKINAIELPVTARIMVVADIFEALTASDRPYKERKTLSQSIKIMSFMVKDDHIDPDVFKLFLTSGVYLQYAQNYLAEDQIDDVDINQYL